jgi:hypothetical protein
LVITDFERKNVNGDSRSTFERGPSLDGLWARRADTRDFCPVSATPDGPEQNIFILTVALFLWICCPHRPASWAGSRAVSPVF